MRVNSLFQGTLLFASSTSAFLAPRSTTQAPYFVPDSHLAPDQYVVRFHPNHTLEDHFINIGMDVRQFAVLFMEMPGANAYLFAVEQGNNSSIHEHIRHDPGVRVVQHDQYSQEGSIGDIEDHVPAHQPREISTKLKRWWWGSGPSGWSLFYRKHDWWNYAMITNGKKISFPDGAQGSYESWSIKDPGKGVDVYIFDTGIKIEHDAFVRGNNERFATHFEGRSTRSRSPFCSNTAPTGDYVYLDDTHGHGTHVAGIVAKGDRGSANMVNLISVKVCLCGGTLAQKETAILRVTKAHNDKKANPPDGWMGSVINFSIGFAQTGDIVAAIRAAKKAGIPIIAAAGNDNKNQIDFPANLKEVFSVGAINIDYERYQNGRGPKGSNYGKAMNIWAPGHNIFSAYIDPKNPHITDIYQPISGTSQASPHVAGVAAIMLSYEGYKKIGVDMIYRRLVANQINAVTSDDVLKAAGTTTMLLQSGIGTHKTSGPPYAGIDHDEFKRDESDQTGPTTVVDDTPLPTTPPDPVSDTDGDTEFFEDVSPADLAQKKCYGLKTSKFVAQDTMMNVLVDKFCPDAQAQAKHDDNSDSITRTYNANTMDEVSVSIQWNSGVTFTPTIDDCTNYLLTVLTEECDSEDDKTNPAWVKGGGETLVTYGTGNVTYKFEPKSTRQPAAMGAYAACNVTTVEGVKKWSQVDLWGTLWGSSDGGAALRTELSKCGVSTAAGGWAFAYKLGPENGQSPTGVPLGHEWISANADNDNVVDANCVTTAISNAGGPVTVCGLNTWVKSQ